MECWDILRIIRHIGRDGVWFSAIGILRSHKLQAEGLHPVKNSLVTGAKLISAAIVAIQVAGGQYAVTRGVGRSNECGQVGNDAVGRGVGVADSPFVWG